jgi:hypothetical protein
LDVNRKAVTEYCICSDSSADVLGGFERAFESIWYRLMYIDEGENYPLDVDDDTSTCIAYLVIL